MKANACLARYAFCVAIVISPSAVATRQHATAGGWGHDPAVAEATTVGNSKATTDADSEVRIRIAVSDDAHDTVRVIKNQRVRLEILTDRPSELHLHGYDLTGHSGPSRPAVFRFKAIHTGRFAIVTHDHASKGLLQRPEQPVAYVEVRTK